MNLRKTIRKVNRDFKQLLEPKCEDGFHCPETEYGRGLVRNIGNVNHRGVAEELAKVDHVHNHPAGLGFDLHHDHYARYIKCIFDLGPDYTQVPAIGRVQLCPIQIPFTVTIDAIVIFYGDACAGNLRVGLYEDVNDDPTGGDLLVESGSVAKAGVGQKQEVAVTQTQLAPGLYWAAAQSDEITTLIYRCHPYFSNGGSVQHYFYDHAYGAFTDPCPALTQDQWFAIILWLRVHSIP